MNSILFVGIIMMSGVCDQQLVVGESKPALCSALISDRNRFIVARCSATAVLSAKPATLQWHHEWAEVDYARGTCHNSAS